MIKIKLDYTIETPEGRVEYVNKLIEEVGEENLSPRYLEILADYMIYSLKDEGITSPGRKSTISKHEKSYEGLAAKFVEGEDGLASIIPAKEDKNIIFAPRISITKKDIAEMPFLAQLCDTIELWKSALKRASGKDAFIIKSAIIEMNKDKYLIKQSYQHPINFNQITHSAPTHIELDDQIEMHEDGEIRKSGFTLTDPKVVEGILNNYSKIKQDSFDELRGDVYYLLIDFDRICGETFPADSLYDKLITYKIDGLTNEVIKTKLQEEFNQSFSVQYISSLWRKKIPKLIAATAESEFLTWWYKKNDLPFKTCTCCKTPKPAHPHFYSRNGSRLYSICKQCRRKG